MSRAYVLGVGIDCLSPAEAVSRMRGYLDGDQARHVVTPNNEMLVEACRNPVFLAVLRLADFAIPDSTGVVWACRRSGAPDAVRVPGVDAVTSLCRGLDEHHGVFLLGAAPGVAERAGEALKKLNPQLRIVGTYAGSPQREEAMGIVERVNDSKASLLLVAYGAPAQDLWISEHLHLMPSVKLAAGIGGTFDFLSGMAKRAPSWMRSAGLEWLWRLALQPSRLPRIFRAVVVFPILVLTQGKTALTPGPSPGGRGGS